MSEASVDYRLGQLDAALKALVNEVRGMRAEFERAFERHDARDDERFASHNSRLAHIDVQLGRGEAAESQEIKHDARRHVWALTLASIAAGFATAAIGAFVGSGAAHLLTTH